jgi:hypothetical protein
VKIARELEKGARMMEELLQEVEEIPPLPLGETPASEAFFLGIKEAAWPAGVDTLRNIRMALAKAQPAESAGLVGLKALGTVPEMHAQIASTAGWGAYGVGKTLQEGLRQLEADKRLAHLVQTRPEFAQRFQQAHSSGAIQGARADLAARMKMAPRGDSQSRTARAMRSPATEAVRGVAAHSAHALQNPGETVKAVADVPLRMMGSQTFADQAHMARRMGFDDRLRIADRIQKFGGDELLEKMIQSGVLKLSDWPVEHQEELRRGYDALLQSELPGDEVPEMDQAVDGLEWLMEDGPREELIEQVQKTLQAPKPTKPPTSAAEGIPPTDGNRASAWGGGDLGTNWGEDERGVAAR